MQMFRVPHITQEMKAVPSDQYTIKPKEAKTRYQKCLQRFADRLYRKTFTVERYVRHEYVMQYDTITVEADKLVNAILQVEHDIYRHFRKGIEMIIVGRNDFAGIRELAQREMHFPMPDHTPLNYCESDGPFRKFKLTGIPVKCIPWCEGIIIVPKDE